MNTVTIGTVVDIDDPSGRGRARVRFRRSRRVVEEWARVATLCRCGGRLDAQHQVLIAFADGDLTQPFVIGSLSTNAPLPASKSWVVTLPTGGSLSGLPTNFGTATDCELAASVLQQAAPWLASTECLLGVLRLLQPLVSVIEALPTPPAAALQQFAKAAAELTPCLLALTPAAALPVVRDLLCAILESLRCLSKQDQPVAPQAVAPLQRILDLASGFFSIVGVPPIQLGAVIDVDALPSDIDAVQAAVDAIGGCSGP